MIWRVTVLLILGFSFPSYGNEPLIENIEKLLNSLSEKDAGRKELTLRLADLYFFLAVDLDKQARLSPNEMTRLDKKALRSRRRAANLYHRALEKYNVNRETHIKIEFQLARVYDQLGQPQKALSFWQKSYNQKEVINIRREAILKLAEKAEQTSSLEKAESLYKEALVVCESSCGFVRYRLGWVYRNQGKIHQALAEVKKALWDKKGQAQEEVLRDYIAFLAQESGDGSRGISIVENLVERTGKKELLQDLAFGFYAAGNKVAGTKTLALVTKREPTLKNQIRLLEEYYGLRRWEDFVDLRERIDPEKISSLDEKTRQNGEKIMRRLAVQLEAEQKQNSEHKEEFLAVTSLYLELFPTGEISSKMINSWLSVASDVNKKMKKIAHWVGNKKFKLSKKEETSLREERARLAQKKENYEILRSEMDWLIKEAYTQTEKREKAKYLIAYSYYKENKLDKAVPLFVQLANPVSEKPSKWSIQSQNLALDIFNQKKNHQALIKQADLWLNREWELPKNIEKELTDIRKVREQANFEMAVAGGKTRDSLNIFLNYCREEKLLPQSCENAKKLAVFLKEQQALLTVLEKTGEKEALINEYEISGHYSKAADLLAAKKPLKGKKWTFDEAIKTSLLYELEGNFAARDRWLDALVDRYKRRPVPQKGEVLFYSALKDAGKLGSRHLSLKWSSETKERLVRFLEETGLGNKKSRHLFLSNKKNQGELWEFYHVKKIFEVAEKEKKVVFYGKRSKRRFRQRLAKIKKLDDYSNRILEQLTSNYRLQVVQVLYQAYNNLAHEIQETPIPKGVEGDALVQIKNSLLGMARPFMDKAESYRELWMNELAKIEDEAVRMAKTEKFKQNISVEVLLAQLTKPEIQKRKIVGLDKVFPLIRKLHKDPFSYEAVSSLKDLYTKEGSERLASYYEGRLQKLKGEGQ